MSSLTAAAAINFGRTVSRSTHLGTLTALIVIAGIDLGPGVTVHAAPPGGDTAPVFTVRASQVGFVGESGKSWAIHADGGFELRSFAGHEHSQLISRGKLPKESSARLLALLKETRLDRIPPALGRQSLNPALITISSGKLVRRLYLASGEKLEPGTLLQQEKNQPPDARKLLKLADATMQAVAAQLPTSQ